MKQKLSLKQANQQVNIVDNSRPMLDVRLEGLKLDPLFRRVNEASNILSTAPMATSTPTKVAFDVHGARYTVTVRVSQQLIQRGKDFDARYNPKPIPEGLPFHKMTYADYYKIDCQGFYNSTHQGTMYVRTRIVHHFEWMGSGSNHIAPIVCLELSLRTGSTAAAWMPTTNFSADYWDKTIKYLQVPAEMTNAPLKVTDGINPNGH